MRHMRRIGIIDERKVLHCLRHRAKDRLRAASCPQDIQYHLLGHERENRGGRLWHRLPGAGAQAMDGENRLVRTDGFAPHQRL